MRRWLGARNGWTSISIRLRHSPARPFSTTNKPTTTPSTSSGGSDKTSNGSVTKYQETYGQLDKLDFMTAAKILFTTPPKKKKFGLDFHLVQFFFACMPSLAVYLVAQYARYEIRRMEAELETKKKAEEEAKAKEDEIKASEEKEEDSNPDLSEVKERLDKLEEAVKKVVESKRQLNKTSTKSPKDASEKEHDYATNNSNTEAKLEASDSKAKDQINKQELEKKTPSLGQVDASS